MLDASGIGSCELHPTLYCIYSYTEIKMYNRRELCAQFKWKFSSWHQNLGLKQNNHDVIIMSSRLHLHLRLLQS